MTLLPYIAAELGGYLQGLPAVDVLAFYVVNAFFAMWLLQIIEGTKDEV